MTLAVLIGIMISIVVGVSLISAIVGKSEVVEETVEVAETSGGLASVLVYVFVIVVILGAVAWIGGTGGTFPLDWIRDRVSGRPNPSSTRKYFYQLAGNLASNLLDDMKDLDGYLGVKTIPVEGTEEEPLSLSTSGKSIGLIRSQAFDWYPVETSAKYPMFKIVGLHRRHRNLNSVYILGKDIHTSIPYLLRLPPNYLERSLDDCIRWCVQAGRGDFIKEV